jgi:CubicO group peptidase (beta-lactamase class C family)
MRRFLALLTAVVSTSLGVAPAPAWSAPASYEAFFDQALPSRMAQFHVPGTVVSVVAGGKEVFAKGYGKASLESGAPIDPATSLVRIASITKLFTWTAVMQQVAAGRLDLNADVNQYLTAFKVPATYPQPVTLLTLMNHTAGFEERVIGTGGRSPGEPLGEYLASHMPARIRPPGEMTAYSNYGAALAGYIVSQVSGQPYDEYVQEHIFGPLEMAHSTATEPIPAGLASGRAASYDSDVTPPRAIPFTFDPMPPEGAISTTADDMARFMLSHLRPDDPLYGTTYKADPRLGGWAHGFEERTVNGHRVLMHDGSWEGFQSLMLLVPDLNLGLFMSANATGALDALPPVLMAFYSSFLSPVPSSVPSASTSDRPRAGFYQPARHNETTVEKLKTMLNSLRLTVGTDGTVHFKGKDWKPIGNGLYAVPDGSDHLVFRSGSAGRHYAATDGPAYQLVTRDETLPFNLLVLLFFVLVALTALGIPLRRRARSRAWRLSRTLAAVALLLGVVFIVSLVAEIIVNNDAFLYGIPTSFTLLLAVPILVLLAWAASMVLAVRGWREAGRWARVHQVVLFAGLATFTWFVWQWNLLGWQF